MALHYRVPLPGPFYYSGRMGPKRWLPRSSRTGPGPMGFVVKWFIVCPSVVFFGAGLAIVFALFYGLFWMVRRSLWNCRRCQPVAQCLPVQPLGLHCPVRGLVSRSYGFVPAQRGRLAAEVGSSSSDRYV